jgi:hypothetical protein
LARWGRPLAVATAAAFVVSSAFPLAAGLAKDTEAFPAWWGPLDVGVAFALALLATALAAVAHGKVSRQSDEASYRAYRVLLHGLLLTGVASMLLGDRVAWAHCVTGFAWRAWLLAYLLPAWLTAFAAGKAPPLTPAPPR